MQARLRSQLYEVVRQSLANRPLLLLDEIHEDDTQMAALAEIIPVAKEAGAKHLCLEYPVALQPILDAYQRGDVTNQELTGFLDYIGFKAPEPHVHIMDAARNAGITLHAVDYRFHDNIPKYSALYNRISEHASPALRDEIKEYFVLKDAVSSDPELPDQLAAALIKKRIGNEKAVVIYGSAHLMNLNLAKTHDHNYHLSDQLDEDAFTYLRVKSSRRNFDDEIDIIGQFEAVTTSIEDKKLTPACNVRSRNGDYMVALDEDRVHATPAGVQRRAAFSSYSLWDGPYACAPEDWDDVLTGLRPVRMEPEQADVFIPPVPSTRPVLLRK